jgi:hypothetical protein
MKYHLKKTRMISLKKYLKAVKIKTNTLCRLIEHKILMISIDGWSLIFIIK